MVQVKGWLCCKVERLQLGLKKSALGQAFQDMDAVQLAAYCIALLAEYVQDSWLAELRELYNVPSSGIRQAQCHELKVVLLVYILTVKDPKSASVSNALRKGIINTCPCVIDPC